MNIPETVFGPYWAHRGYTATSKVHVRCLHTVELGDGHFPWALDIAAVERSMTNNSRTYSLLKVPNLYLLERCYIRLITPSGCQLAAALGDQADWHCHPFS